MAETEGWLTVRRAIISAVLIVVIVGGVIGVAALSNSSPQHSSQDKELKGYTFVYHPGSNVTIVKQSFTDNMSRLKLVGPSGSVSWKNASGGSTNMAGLFNYHRTGATPGSTLRIKKELSSGKSSYYVTKANSTVPNGASNGQFVILYHQKPAVTIVNVNPSKTSTAHLKLVGPHGSVSWANASLGSKPTSATFAWNRHAIGATAGDNITLVRVNPQTGNRTKLKTSEIP